MGDPGRAGLVERREDPTNRRRTLAAPAPTHRATVHAFVAQRAGPLLKVLEALLATARALLEAVSAGAPGARLVNDGPTP